MAWKQLSFQYGSLFKGISSIQIKLSEYLGVSCVLQFCGLAVIETKNRAMAVVAKLEEQLDFPKKVRIHWTGCPNSCGQVRVSSFDPRHSHPAIML